MSDRTNSNSPARPAAAAAAAVAAAEVPAAPILREWSDATPVAPAVVLPSTPQPGASNGDLVPPTRKTARDDNAAGGEDSSGTPQYPVAALVASLVRTGFDSIYAHAGIAERIIDDSTGAATANHDPLSIRSDDVNLLRQEAATPQRVSSRMSVASEPATTTTATTTTASAQEFDAGAILVDGDLIEYEAPPEVMDDEEFRARQNVRGRFGRGIRKVGKWIKRRKEKKKQLRRPSDREVRQHQQQEITEGLQDMEALRPCQPLPTRSSSIESTVSSNNGLQRELSPRRIPEQPSLEPTASLLEPTASLLPDEQSMSLREVLPMAPITECRETSTASAMSTAVAADFIGTADLVSESMTANFASAEAFVEHDHDEFSMKTDGSMMKVKAEEMHLDSMLQQAQLETRDDEPDDLADVAMLEDDPHRKPQAKSTGSRVPLSAANVLDDDVFNDTLKIVMVGTNNAEKSGLARAMCGKKAKRPRASLGVDVHTWTPGGDYRFSIWDVASANAGAHAATQSLFFSPDTLYVLVWDLAAENVFTIRRQHVALDVTDDEHDDDDDWNDFRVEEHIRQADRALEAEINENVLSWLDLMATPGSAILPVVTVPIDMEEDEVDRRRQKLETILGSQKIFKRKHNAPRLILMDTSILKVNVRTGDGVGELQDIIQAIAAECVFDNLGMKVSTNAMEVLDTIRRLKQDHKVILLDHLLGEMKTQMYVHDVQAILHFLSNIGELLYFGKSTDEVLSRYIILSRKWLVSALSCILRPDLQRELCETRRFMNLQSIYSGEAFVESDIVQTLLKGTNSSCPLLSAKDSAMLWQSMSFMRDAADRTAQLSEASNTMYDFLERLLKHSNILLPLAVSGEPTYFVPSLLPKAEPGNIWTYKTSDSWMTTLCHSWLLRDVGPASVMEHVTTSLLQDLYEFSHTFHGYAAKPAYHHSKSFPLGKDSYSEVIDAHDLEVIGRIKIHQVMCWKSSILVKIGCCFADHDQTDLRESFAEIYVAMVDDQSNHCVATDGMVNGQKRLIVCGKGQVGHYGRKLWKGGYGLVLDSIKTALADQNGVDRQVVCPECLAHTHPSQACTWSWDNVVSSAQNGLSGVRCVRGHSVSTSLLCGTCSPVAPAPKSAPPEAAARARVSRPVSSLLNSIVVVGLWDPKEKQVRSVGSGFIVDKKNGLVITAGHVLFNMKGGSDFGSPYFGVKNAKAVIGVIPGDEHNAVWRYFGEIVAHDIHRVDACVLRITTRLENDVDDQGEGCADQAELPMVDVSKENLPILKMTRKFELEETVRILGFNQGGEGVREKGKHVNRTVDFAEGYICKQFKAARGDDDSDSESSSSSNFAPREEIVVICPTISGHSGGPFVNGEGKVVGILSRADPVDRNRCYLVPASELKQLLSRAKYQPVHMDFV